MSDPRNVIACVSHPCETTGYCPPGQPHAVEYQPVLDLPDAAHVHITRHPDGTFTATPMVLGAVRGPYEWVLDEPMHTARRAWVDCPTGGDQERGA